MAAIVVLGSLVGCSGRTSEDSVEISRYVAIGDSFVSGPLIAPVDPTVPACGRSERNYPRLVAKSLDGSTLVDVSCPGSTTNDVRVGGKKGAAQLAAVSPKTQLVTVGIGENDFGLSTGWFNHCLLATRSEVNCSELVSKFAPSLLARARENVTAVLTEAKRRAPKAKVLLVGYLRLTPDEGSCDALPISEANRAASESLEEDISVMQRAAAKDAKVQFVDVRPLSKGHDVCAGDKAWVNGLTSGDGLFLHPNSAGMKAVADEVLRVIRDE